MSKYTIYINSTVSASREVEAESLEEAIDIALEDPPYAPGFADYEFSDSWEPSPNYQIDGVFMSGGQA